MKCENAFFFFMLINSLQVFFLSKARSFLFLIQTNKKERSTSSTPSWWRYSQVKHKSFAFFIEICDIWSWLSNNPSAYQWQKKNSRWEYQGKEEIIRLFFVHNNNNNNIRKRSLRSKKSGEMKYVVARLLHLPWRFHFRFGYNTRRRRRKFLSLADWRSELMNGIDVESGVFFFVSRNSLTLSNVSQTSCHMVRSKKTSSWCSSSTSKSVGIEYRWMSSTSKSSQTTFLSTIGFTFIFITIHDWKIAK